jgi:hypothetical protein
MQRCVLIDRSWGEVGGGGEPAFQRWCSIGTMRAT